MACVTWSKSKTTKGLRYLQIRENSVRENKNIEVLHIPGKINPADMFTKEDKDAAHFKQLRDATVSTSFANPNSNNDHTSNKTSDMTGTKSNKTQPSLDSSRDCRSSHSSQSADIGKTSVPGPSSHESYPCIESANAGTNKIQNNEPLLQSRSNYLQNFPPIQTNPEIFKQPTKISQIPSYAKAVLSQHERKIEI